MQKQIRESILERFKKIEENTSNVSTNVPAPVSKEQKLQEKENSLWKEYVQARTRFLAHCKVEQIPLPFQFPYLYFYRKDNQIFTIERYQYGKSSSNLLVPKTFTNFLAHVCLIQYHGGPTELEAFFTALTTYLLKRPRTKLQSFAEQIRSYSPVLGSFLDPAYQNQIFFTSRDGNLLFDWIALIGYVPKGEPRHQFVHLLLDILFTPNEHGDYAFSVPPRLLRLYFGTLIQEYRNEPEKYSLKIAEAPENSVMFQGKRQNLHFYIKYDTATDQFYPKQINRNDSTYGLKTMPVSAFKYKLPSLDNVKAFFRSLCGHDVMLLDKLALTFCDLMDSHHGGLTVLYAPHNAALLSSTMEAVFCDCLVQFTKPATLSKLTKNTGRIVALSAQHQEKSVVLVKDTLPSETTLKNLRRLLKGKSIPVKTDILQPQNYINHLHILCITDDRRKARFLKQKLKANLIDFSAAVQPTDRKPYYTDEELNWLRLNFTAYGLKLKTLQHRNLADPCPFQTKPDDASIRDSETEVEAFLLECCRPQKNAFCTTKELYDWYVQYVQRTYPGQAPLWSKICFNKELRKVFAADHSKQIVYKRDRSSRQARSLYGYAGLRLYSLPEQTKPTAPIRDVLSEYLDHINRYAIKQPFTVSVTVN